MNPSWVHTAGDTLSFQVWVTDYPSTDGWTLTYYLTPRFASPVQAQIVLVASGNADGSYQVAEAAANTASWKPGAYGWHRRVEKAGVKQTLTTSEDQGECLVRQDPATAVQGYDSRSHARIVLDAIRAVIEGRATTDQEEYTIGSRSLKRTPLEELRELERDYAQRVRAEDAEAALDAGEAPGRRLLARL